MPIPFKNEKHNVHAIMRRKNADVLTSYIEVIDAVLVLEGVDRQIAYSIANQIAVFTLDPTIVMYSPRRL